MSFDFFQQEQNAALLNASRNPGSPDPGVFDNFASGAGSYAMRSLAEVGRAASMAGAVFPIALDAMVGDDNHTGQTLADQYFAQHDATFGNAVDYWTPKPGEVGTAGQVAGQLVGGLLQAAISPAVLVGTTQLSTAEELVRNGVDPTTATEVGAIQGAGMAVGVRMPFIGQSLATRMLSGAGGNLAQGVGTSLATSELLTSRDYDKQAEQFNPWDLRARVLDVALGAAFGGLAHLEGKITPTDEAALLVSNQARHLEDASPNGRPLTDADMTQHVAAMRQAVEQVLKGEDVSVDHLTHGMKTAPDETQFAQRMEVMNAAHDITEGIQKYEAPFEVASQPTLIDNNPDISVTGQHARRVVTENPDMIIATGLDNPDGSLHTIRAADAMALAETELAFVKSRGPDVFKTAALCLLGVL